MSPINISNPRQQEQQECQELSKEPKSFLLLDVAKLCSERKKLQPPPPQRTPSHTAVAGDVAALATLGQLRSLNLGGSAAVARVTLWRREAPRPLSSAIHRAVPKQMAPPRVGATLAAALLLAGRAADVVAQSHGSQPPSASLEDDLAILLAFRAVGANSQDDFVGTWAAGGGGPCDEASFDAYDAGWKGVMCCASYDGTTCTGANAGRVTYLYLYYHEGVSGDIGPLGRLAELRHLALDYTAVAGDVAALAALGQLRFLKLDRTAVAGDVAALAPLGQLQTLSLDYTAVVGDVAALAALGQLQSLVLYHTAVAGDVAALATLGQLQYLGLSNTAVWGRADALRAIPGLGADWNHFTACTAGTSYYPRPAADFGQCPAGRSPVADGASYLGADECACCSGSLKMRDPTTGACVDPPGESRLPRTTRLGIHTRVAELLRRASLHSVPSLPHFTAHRSRAPCRTCVLRLFAASFSAPVSFQT
eukprot:COSAG06_NODE_5115_length_3711_cov_17.818660_3_plen_480_part_00